MKRKYSYFTFLFCLLFLSFISVQLTASYFTDSPQPLKNVFTMGDIKIELKEEQWDESEADHLHPKESTAKDPVIVNTGKVPAFVFLEVRVPVKNIRIVDESGHKTDAAPVELFSFEADLMNWTLVDLRKEETYVQYVYGYYQILDPQEYTTALFGNVTAVNYLEGELDPSEVYSIDIHAKAIQSQLDTESLSLPEIYLLLIKSQEKEER